MSTQVAPMRRTASCGGTAKGKAAAQATPIATAVTATGADISPEVMLDDAECYLVCGCFDDAADAAVKVLRSLSVTAAAKEAADGGSLVTCALFVLLQALDRMMRVKDAEKALEQFVGGADCCHSSVALLLATLLAAQGKPGREAASELLDAYVTGGSKGEEPALRRLAAADSTNTMAEGASKCARMYAVELLAKSDVSGGSKAATAWLKAMPEGALPRGITDALLKEVMTVELAQTRAEAELARTAPILPVPQRLKAVQQQQSHTSPAPAPQQAVPEAVPVAQCSGAAENALPYGFRWGEWPLDSQGALAAGAGCIAVIALLSRGGQATLGAVGRSVTDLGRAAFGTGAVAAL